MHHGAISAYWITIGHVAIYAMIRGDCSSGVCQVEQLTDAFVLRSKFFFPAARRNTVPRPRLVERLNEGLTGSLTLISAPAGYGKSTLITEWRAGPGAETAVAWLSLDHSDNDPARFWLYFLTALNTIQGGLVDEALALLASLQRPPTETFLTVLINGLDAISQDIVLVLDDMHVINTPEIHEMLAFFLDHLPPQMHLLLLTRADPPLPLARMRLNGQLAEVRQRDLRFTTEEAEVFLNRVMGLNLKADDIHKLMERTEGWIAGLQLAALSVSGQKDPTAIIAAFGGGYHYIVDYLVQEVLDSQPDALRMFLLQTSILDRLTGSLCNALTGQRDGEKMLMRLEQASLFLLPLDAECCWYRYHHLFADVTHSLLRQTYPEQIPELHRRAARWYAQNGSAPEAIKHALAARDWEYAGSVMDDYSSMAWRSGEITRVLEWVEELPNKVLLTYPKLSVNYGWACVLTGRYEECDRICAQVEPSVRNQPELLVDWLTVQVFLARAKGQQARAVELAREAQGYPEIGGVDTRALLIMSLCIALWDLGRVKESAAAAEEAARLAEQARNWHAWAVLHGFMGLAQAAFGNLRLAEEIYQRVSRGIPGAPKWAGGGFAQVCLSALLYEWNDLEGATEYALAGLEYSQITGLSEIQLNCYRQLAFIYQAQRKPQTAWEVLGQGEQVIRKHPIPRLWGPEHIQLALAQMDLSKALYWSENVQGEYGAAIHYPAIPLERAKVALAQGNKAKAADLLTRSYQKASQDGIRYAQIEIRILQALAAADEEQGICYLREALEWAETEGFCRLFVDQGKALRPLLRRAAQLGFCSSYVVRLLSSIEIDYGSPLSDSEQPLAEPLTERELEVLALVAAGQSNREIAQELVVALGTVKTHVHNICGKLNVRSRTQCAARARELKLLE